MSSTEQSSPSSSFFNGRVKWFNNKAGYGFVTTENDTYSGDVFVHHTQLVVGEEQYKYLVQGEYVEFQLSRVSGGTHEWQASSVRGVNGGKLMCETRREARVSRVSHASQHVGEQTHSSDNSQARRPRVRSQAVPVPRVDNPQEVPRPRSRQPRRIPVKVVGPTPDSNGEWMLVRRRPRDQGELVRRNTSGPGHEQRSYPRQQRRPRIQRQDTDNSEQ